MSYHVTDANFHSRIFLLCVRIVNGASVAYLFQSQQPLQRYVRCSCPRFRRLSADQQRPQVSRVIRRWVANAETIAHYAHAILVSDLSLRAPPVKSCCVTLRTLSKPTQLSRLSSIDRSYYIQSLSQMGLLLLLLL